MAALTLLLFLVGSCMAPNLYDLGWLVAAVIALFCVAGWARAAFRAPVLVLALYLGLRAAWAAVDVPYPQLSVIILRQTALLAGLLAMAFIAQDEIPRLIRWALPLSAVATALGYGPLYHNTTMNSALLVAALPFAVHPITMALVILAVVFGQNGAAPYVMLPLWVLLQRSLWGWWLLPAGAALAWKLWANAHMFHEMYRVRFWLATWAFFREHVPQVLGSGLGTFLLYGKKVQAQFPSAAIEGANWRTVHNDWLQLLFETGWLGLALGLWVYLDSLWRADHATRVSLLLVGFCALFHFPMQAPLFAAFCVWLVVRAQQR